MNIKSLFLFGYAGRQQALRRAACREHASGRTDFEQNFSFFALRGVQAYVKGRKRKKQTKYNKLAEKPWFFNLKSNQYTKMIKGEAL